jgi:UDP-N-acetylmuramate: L-alanyl-gamma-D-glutamyl-meso-diaminopimelate ligase
MKSFKGLKRHLELMFENDQITIYKDQGQHPQKFKAAAEALKEQYSDRRLIVILDPHASVLHDINSLKFYDHTLNKADFVIIGMIKIRKLKKEESKHNRVTGRRIRNAIKRTQPKVKYLPVDRQILKWLKENQQSGDVLLFLTTGSFRTLIQDTVEMFSDP